MEIQNDLKREPNSKFTKRLTQMFLSTTLVLEKSPMTDYLSVLFASEVNKKEFRVSGVKLHCCEPFIYLINIYNQVLFVYDTEIRVGITEKGTFLGILFKNKEIVKKEVLDFQNQIITQYEMNTQPKLCGVTKTSIDPDDLIYFRKELSGITLGWFVPAIKDTVFVESIMKKEKSQAINDSDINKLYSIAINMIMDKEYILKPDEIDKLCETIPEVREISIPKAELFVLIVQKILRETNIRIERYIAISNYFESIIKPDGKCNVKLFITRIYTCAHFHNYPILIDKCGYILVSKIFLLRQYLSAD